MQKVGAEVASSVTVMLLTYLTSKHRLYTLSGTTPNSQSILNTDCGNKMANRTATKERMTDFAILEEFRNFFVTNASHAKTMLPTRKSVPRSSEAHEDLLTIVKRRKLQWYGHVSRSSGLAKTILQGTVKEKRRQGRQKKRWEDNIREWTGLEFSKSQRTVENREKWRKLAAKSSVVP